MTTRDPRQPKLGKTGREDPLTSCAYEEKSWGTRGGHACQEKAVQGIRPCRASLV
jgi:hypothetical protein